MERKDFLKNTVGFIGLATIANGLESCKKDSGTGTDSNEGGSNGSCTATVSETDGPYPLYSSRGSAIQRVDITEGKTGIPLSMNITIKNLNNNCAVVENARVDVWHCDKDGYYSGYSNSGYLGTQNNSNLTFCRGLQYTDATGVAKFTTIYPGWYTGRITHVHVQIYVGSTLKLTTQIAFPEAVTTAVYNTSLYSAHGQNSSVAGFSSDNVFSDGTSTELATVVANSTTGGYDLTHTIYISV